MKEMEAEEIASLYTPPVTYSVDVPSTEISTSE
jgi:hypothetical protein